MFVLVFTVSLTGLYALLLPGESNFLVTWLGTSLFATAMFAVKGMRFLGLPPIADSEGKKEHEVRELENKLIALREKRDGLDRETLVVTKKLEIELIELAQHKEKCEGVAMLGKGALLAAEVFEAVVPGVRTAGNFAIDMLATRPAARDLEKKREEAVGTIARLKAERAVASLEIERFERQLDAKKHQESKIVRAKVAYCFSLALCVLLCAAALALSYSGWLADGRYASATLSAAEMVMPANLLPPVPWHVGFLADNYEYPQDAFMWAMIVLWFLAALYLWLFLAATCLAPGFAFTLIEMEGDDLKYLREVPALLLLAPLAWVVPFAIYSVGTHFLPVS